MSVNKDLELFMKANSWELDKLKGRDVVYFIIENFKPNIHSSISWHIENQELSGINNEYDQGWYDALIMIKRYFDSE